MMMIIIIQHLWIRPNRFDALSKLRSRTQIILLKTTGLCNMQMMHMIQIMRIMLIMHMIQIMRIMQMMQSTKSGIDKVESALKQKFHASSKSLQMTLTQYPFIPFLGSVNRVTSALFHNINPMHSYQINRLLLKHSLPTDFAKTWYYESEFHTEI